MPHSAWIASAATSARVEPSLNENAPTRRPPTAYLSMLVVAAAILALDQSTKQLALTLLEHRPIVLIDGLLQLRLAFNPGGAFGILQGFPSFFFVATVIVVALILVIARNVDRTSTALALGLVLGGGLGNLADRLLRDFDGRVVDFIDFRFWPVFNLADSAIVVGVSLVLIFGARSHHDEGAQPSA